MHSDAKIRRTRQPPICALIILYTLTIGAKYFVRAVNSIYTHNVAKREGRRDDIAACERRWLHGNVGHGRSPAPAHDRAIGPGCQDKKGLRDTEQQAAV
jgi:hypothetical protein